MTLPTTMRAIEISEPGGPEVLRPVTRPVPVPNAEDILIKVVAAGVNRPDALQRAGAYAPPPDASDLPGLECAGEVVAVGTGVSRWAIGDKVCALLPGGGYAEYVTTHQDHALAVPAGLSMIEAAALPETFFTVWTNVFERGCLEAGEVFLVHGGTSGIGTTAIQLASAMGARVFATAGSAEKCAKCVELGAELAINYNDEDYVSVVKDATNGRGVDLILDMVGGTYIARNIRALAVDGRLAMIAFLGGPKAEINFAQIMAKRITVTGSTLRPRSIQDKAVIAEALREIVWPMIEAGRIAPVMDSTFSLDQAADAHRRIESSGHIGKIVLQVS
ncbi:NAD(P)H-quinone oxidoreductase [Rhodobacterales bacterium 52_120_T64]|nr:NAD(P)H-quinone oxidoreductase [Rhodobacterales bacterium 52_120_T64]